MQEDSGFGPLPRRRGRGNALTHVVTAVLGAALAAGLLLAFYDPAAGSQSGSGTTSSSLNSSEENIAARVKPGVVLINTTLQYNGEAAAGTGMVINADGLVLTNNHVIADSTNITATVVSTGKTYPATAVGYDKTGDVALIRLRNASGLTTVPVASSSPPKAGETVVALGNAEGQGTIIAKAGQITGLDKTITASNDAGSATSETLHGMIETNADIVAGDSGGPLSSSAGVIGMDTAGNGVSGPEQGSATGFTIPISTAMSVARQITADQASSTIAIGYPPFLGVFVGSGTSSSPQTQAQQQEQQQNGGSGSQGTNPGCYTSNANLTVPSAIAPVRSGTLIDGIICGSPAASAGLTAGAVITAVNGQAVGSPDDFSSVLTRFHPGDTISVSWVSPSGQPTTSRLQLTDGPPL